MYYYDVNYSYPFASLNDLPGLHWKYVDFVKQPNLDELFGFFYCKVKTTGKYKYIGLLPYRTDDERLILPLVEWEGGYFSEELKFTKNHGYEISLIKGYITNRSTDVFKNFVYSIYKLKSNPRNVHEKKCL